MLPFSTNTDDAESIAPSTAAKYTTSTGNYESIATGHTTNANNPEPIPTDSSLATGHITNADDAESIHTDFTLVTAKCAKSEFALKDSSQWRPSTKRLKQK